MKRLSLIFAVVFGVSIVVIFSLGYHGNRIFTDGISLPDVQSVIKSARDLTGVPYDPLMGMHNNIGAKAGFIVCSDVPNIAYGTQGYSWKKILENDFQFHPGAYDSEEGNNPDNPYFHRRARNLFAYFKANNRLMDENYQPAPGDLVFYRKTEKGYIAHVTLVTELVGESFLVMESAPKTVFAQEVEADSPLNRGWIFAGFGKVY